MSAFHSVEAPKGSGKNYGTSITPFVLAKVKQRNGEDAYIMETGFRERQGISPRTNPFNPATTIRFSMPQVGIVTLNVYNLLGQQVATQRFGLQQPREREVVFNPVNLTSGIYLYRLEMTDLTAKPVRATPISKMLLAK